MVLVLNIILSISFFTACFQREFEYRGDYPELFSVAVGSLLGTRGFSAGGPPSGLQPSIRLLEEDYFGRRLFFFGDDTVGPNHVIMQKVEGDYVYFYPHYNFISSSWGEYQGEGIDFLKKANSWNQEISNDGEFVRVRIVRQKERGPISNDKLVEVYNYIFTGINFGNRNISNSLMIFLRADRYGRSVYAGIGSGSEWIGTHIVVLFQPDHSFDPETGILLIEDRNRYQTALRLFMEANGWDTPFMVEEQ